MSDRDYNLSMSISRRPRTDREADDDLRGLLVHRLSDTDKAVGRLSLRNGQVGVFCEGCGKWTRIEEFELDYDCSCGRKYRMEFAVYEEVE